MDLKIMRNPISAKVDFCDTSLAKCLVFQSQTHRFRPKNHQKKQPGNSYENMFFNPNVFNNLSEWVPTNKQKSINPSLDLTVSFLVLPNVPGSSQGPQDGKVEAPSMPNDTRGH